MDLQKHIFKYFEGFLGKVGIYIYKLNISIKDSHIPWSLSDLGHSDNSGQSVTSIFFTTSYTLDPPLSTDLKIFTVCHKKNWFCSIQ